MRCASESSPVGRRPSSPMWRASWTATGSTSGRHDLGARNRRGAGLRAFLTKMNDEPSSEGARVVIAGGGVAGIEALLALRDLAGDRAKLTLVAPQPDFLYKPLLVEEPFGLNPAERRELAPVTEEVGATLVQAPLSGVRSED